jgi:general secretion pathway protein C
MFARLSAFVVWGLVAGTIVFWALRLLVQPGSTPPYAVAVGESGAQRADLSRLLGAAPVTTAAATVQVAPEMASRFKLIGVMAPKVSPPVGDPSPGLALIAVDGKPPRAFEVGSSLDGDMVLQSVSLRTASIGPAQGATAVKLELPPLPLPATGTLAPSFGAVPAKSVNVRAPLPPSVMQSQSTAATAVPNAPPPIVSPMGAPPARSPNQN